MRCRLFGHRPVRGRPYPNFVVIWCARCHLPMSDRYRLLPIKWVKVSNRDPWQDAVDSPEMPGPGYDAQTRRLQ